MRIEFAAYLGRNLAIFLVATLWAAFAVAQQSPAKAPSELCVLGGECWNDDDAGGSGDEYTLASIGSIPFAYSVPIPPVIDSEVTVTPSTIEANKVNGRRIILSAGSYGNQTFNTQDQEIVFQDGVVFNLLTVGSSAARLVFRGEPARAGVTGYIRVGATTAAASDIVFDGINQAHYLEGGSNPRQDNKFNARRMVIINSNLEARNFVFLSYSSTGGRLQDVIVANNDMVDGGSDLSGNGQGQATFRTQGAARLIFVDNRLAGHVRDRYHNFRIHAEPGFDAEDFYIARNQFEGTGHAFSRSGDGQATGEIRNVWYVDNVQYHETLIPISYGEQSVTANDAEYMIEYTMQNNVLISSINSNWNPPPPAVVSGSGYSWQISGNTSQPYEAPPPWQFR